MPPKFCRRIHLSFHYSAFGHVLHSNVPIPGVPPSSPAPVQELSSGQDGADVNFHLGSAPALASNSHLPEELSYESSYLNESGEPVLCIWKAVADSSLRLAYCDGTQFWLDHARQNVWATWPAHLSLENTLSYLLGPVVGLLLRLRGVTCLHASAVAFSDSCAVFVGPEGAGKSTTAAAFAKRGHPVLSDDIVALASLAPGLPAFPLSEVSASSAGTVPDVEFLALPAYPHIYLWPDSASLLHDSPEELPRISPGWDKRRLALDTKGTHFASRALPIAAIYLFAERASDPAPHVGPAPAKASLLSLLANTYANNLLDRALRSQEFALLDRLVSSVPIRLLTPHQDPARLDQLCSVIRQDFLHLQHSRLSPPLPPNSGLQSER